MKRFKLAALTMFALPFPLVAILVSVHCQSAGFPVPDPDALGSDAITLENPDSRFSVAAGQSITSLMISPAAMTGKQVSTGTVTLRYPAPTGGLVVTLDNRDPAHVHTPAQVSIPVGETQVRFQVTSSPVSSLTSTNLFATYQGASASTVLTLLPTPKAQWFVSASGNQKAHGTKDSPWDLATALRHGPKGTEVRPGDTIWLRGGRYKGSFLSTLMGTNGQPIIVRALPGERVIIDRGEVSSEKQPALKVRGSWVWFWGIEVTNTSGNRQRSSPYTGQDQPWRGSGADVYAPNVKFINMTFHDNGQGIWDKQDMTEIHGCLFFYNGNNKREHGLYIGNRLGTKFITDNILFAQGGYGILGHSDSSSSSQKGMHIEGNVSFNNGMITGDDQKTGNLQVGGVDGESAERIVIGNNHIYNDSANPDNKDFGIRLGYEDRANKDIELVNNYIVSKTPLLLWWWRSATVEGNTIYSTGDDLVEVRMPEGVSSSTYTWNFNQYFSAGPSGRFLAGTNQNLAFARWRQLTGLDRQSSARLNTRPQGVQVFIRPNRYEEGRANVVVYNWTGKDQIAVDLTGVLKAGVQFEIRDVQDYFGPPLVRGIYKGGPVLVPMKLTNVTAPIGNVERQPRHTSPEFGAYVVQVVPKTVSR